MIITNGTLITLIGRILTDFIRGLSVISASSVFYFLLSILALYISRYTGAAFALSVINSFTISSGICSAVLKFMQPFWNLALLNNFEYLSYKGLCPYIIMLCKLICVFTLAKA